MAAFVLLCLLLIAYVAFGDNYHYPCDSSGDCTAGYSCKDHEKCFSTTCFPGDAMVETSDGTSKQMSKLQIGDHVLSHKLKNKSVYSPIYSFGHKDHHITSMFHKIQSNRGIELHVTTGHYLPILSGKNELTYKRAENIQPGDGIWTTAKNSSLELYNVTDVSEVSKQGLFNPFTLSGTIIVENVMASAHSEWLLDPIFVDIDLVHWLPYIYQVILSPIRLIFNIAGTKKIAYFDYINLTLSS